MQRSAAAEDNKRKFDSLSSDAKMDELFVSWKASLPKEKRPQPYSFQPS